MSVIHLVLDSTVYKQAPQLETELFQHLRRQCRVGIISLYVPAVVEQEYLTWVEEEVTTTTHAITKAIRPLNRLAPNPDSVDLISYLTASELKDRQSKAVDNWASFKSDTGAVLVPISENAGARVMEDYFAGAKPFRKRKSRDDIPDAFIRHAILALTKKHGAIYLVTQDRKFAESFSDTPKVKITYDLSEFLQLPEVASQTGLVFRSDQIDAARQMLVYYKDELQKMIKRAIANEIDTDLIGEAFYEAYMDEPMTFDPVRVRELELDKEKISQLGERTLLLPFQAEVAIEVAYGLEAGDCPSPEIVDTETRLVNNV